MVALKGRSIQDFVADRPAAILAVLIYGPDAGLVRERSDALARSVVKDFQDPFNFIELTESEIKGDAARLADEAAALSMTGDMRVVRVRLSGDGAAKSVTACIDALESDALKPTALILLEAGELTKRSAIRKSFEGGRRVAALPCYEDSPKDVRDVIRAGLRDEDISIDAEALDLVAAGLGGDRGLTRAAIEKLILYMGPKALRDGPVNVRRTDAAACLAEDGEHALDALTAAAAGGDFKALEAEFHRASAAGASTIGLLRALQRHFDRLYTARTAMAGGLDAGAAMKRLRPPVFFAEAKRFEAQLRRWDAPRLAMALQTLHDAERAAKSAGAPQAALAERAALRLASLSARSAG
ncbi:MAG: DNA polymerase III subunit delta [Pseudomonadota bacterium]